jgi:hypothetical protein
MTARGYTAGLLLGLALLLALAAAVNWLVDPFWYFRGPEIEGFNAVKPKFARFERHIKPQLLARERPQAIVLGSSLAEIGFDAGNAALTAGGRLRAYNFAFAGADWDLVQCHFDYAVDATDLKRAVIGVHPGPLPAPRDCGSRLAEIRDFSPAKLLVSLQVLNQSLQTVLEQGRRRSSHTRDGRYLYARGTPGVDARFREFLLDRVRSDPSCARERVPVSPPPSKEIAPADVTPATGLDLSGLRSVIRKARGRDIELRLVAYPQHALFVELDLLCGQAAKRWAAVAAIARVVAEEAPRGGVELWDFYGYNEVTGERIAGRSPTYWQDPEHFNFEMGGMMLSDMFGGTPHGRLGRRIDPGSVDEAYRAFLAGRARFLANHPRFYDDLRAVLPPVR